MEMNTLTLDELEGLPAGLLGVTGVCGCRGGGALEAAVASLTIACFGFL